MVSKINFTQNGNEEVEYDPATDEYTFTTDAGNTVTVQSDGTVDSPALDTARVSVKNRAVQTALEGYVVPIANGVGVSDAIDPSATSTPVQDAIDVVNANGVSHYGATSGAVLVPPENVQEAAPLSGLGGITLQGWNKNASRIEFTDLTADGIQVAGTSDGRRAFIDGVTISGSDYQNRTGGVAIHFTGNTDEFNMGDVRFIQWNDVIHQDTGHPFNSHWNKVRCELGGGRGYVIDSAGPDVTIGSMIVKNTGQESIFTPSAISGINLKIGQLVHGNSTSQLRLQMTGGYVEIGNLHHEGGSASDLCWLTGGGHVRLHSIRNLQTVDFVVEQDGAAAGNNIIGNVENLGTINNNIVNLRNTADLYSEFWGTTADVTNTAGGTNGTFFCKKSQAFADV